VEGESISSSAALCNAIPGTFHKVTTDYSDISCTYLLRASIIKPVGRVKWVPMSTISNVEVREMRREIKRPFGRAVAVAETAVPVAAMVK
jgi:hypothetical protein